jgi:hypothetical protein
MKRLHPEDDQCRYLTQWRDANQRRIKELKWLYHIPMGGKRSAITASILKAMGARKGIWDYILFARRGINPGLIIEMKAGKNKLTEEQDDFGMYMLEQGWITAVCYSWTDAASTISAYLGHDKGFT